MSIDKELPALVWVDATMGNSQCSIHTTTQEDEWEGPMMHRVSLGMLLFLYFNNSMPLSFRSTALPFFLSRRAGKPGCRSHFPGNHRLTFASVSQLAKDFEKDSPSQQTNEAVAQSMTEIAHLVTNWRSDPRCNPTLHFPAWICPGPHIQSILRSALTQPYLASHVELLDHLHVRFKVVRHCNEEEEKVNTDEKLILLHPNTPPMAALQETVQTFLSQQNCRDAATTYTVSFQYHQFTASFLLNQLLPEAVHPVPTAFEMVGHVAHLNLRAPHLPYRFLIGSVLLETLPTIETVIQKVGEVTGPYRTFDYELLAGRNSTLVHLTESGVALQFDLQNVYWCSRLSEERQRLLKEEILCTTKTKATGDAPLILADIFCGVGALLLQAAMPSRRPGIELWANDWNPHATAALRVNAHANGIPLARVTTQDAYDCLMDLGAGWGGAADTELPPPRATLRRGRRRSVPPSLRRPDHVVMNFPLAAPQFLGALRWWSAPTDAEPGTRFHVYTFARETDDRSVEDVAVEMIADQLLPRPAGTALTRHALDETYQCRVRTHVVRDVAPGKVVVCVSFSATAPLLRHMRGDYSLE